MKEINLSKSQCELIYNESLAKLAERIADCLVLEKVDS